MVPAGNALGMLSRKKQPNYLHVPKRNIYAQKIEQIFEKF